MSSANVRSVGMVMELIEGNQESRWQQAEWVDDAALLARKLRVIAPALVLQSVFSNRALAPVTGALIPSKKGKAGTRQ